MWWAALGAMIAVSLEWWYRTRGTYPLWLIPPALALNYCIYKLLTTSNDNGMGYLSSIAIFSGMTALLRVSSAFILMKAPITVLSLMKAGALLFSGLWR